MSAGAPAGLIAQLGPAALPVRRLLGEIVGGAPAGLDALVERSGLPRRAVEALLRALGDDVRDGRFTGRGEDYAALLERPPALPSLEAVRRIVAAAPAPLRDLDHVPATAETVLARVARLTGAYDLTQARALFLGDHDGTALALARTGQGSPTVVDIDERVLAHAAAGGVHALFADLRVGLPPSLRGAFDVVFTDPPYTPDGVGLFCARALEALRDPPTGRVLLAYGYPESQPALGLKVQRELAALELVSEAVEPGFNAYHGAHAIGARAALYTLRATRRSVKLAARRGPGYARGLYTHGRQAVESAGGTPTDLAALLRGELPSLDRIDLRPYYGRSLVQACLAARTERVEVLVDNETEGLRSAAEQARLAAVLAPVYAVAGLERSRAGTRDTLVRLARVAPDGPAGAVFAHPFDAVGEHWPGAPVDHPFLRDRLLDLPTEALLELQRDLLLR